MSHLRAAGIGAFDDKAYPDERIAVRASRTHRVLIEEFELIFLEPHQPKTFRTASDLRSHTVPLRLVQVYLMKGE